MEIQLGGGLLIVGVGASYTTICLRERSRLVMNLRVRMVTWESAMIARVFLSVKDSQSEID